MSCCGNHNHGGQQNHSQDTHSTGKKKSHNWMMILCCVLPIALVGVLLLTKTTSGTLGNVLPLFLLMICPLSHLILMPLMMRKKKNHNHS